MWFMMIRNKILIVVLLISSIIIVGCTSTGNSLQKEQTMKNISDIQENTELKFISNLTNIKQSEVEKCNQEWECFGWSECSSFGKQTRTCTDQNNCGVSTGKPSESQSCTPKIIEPPPITLSGTGQEATSKFNLEKGISIFEMKHDGTSNFAIVLYGANGEYIDLLVNTIGQFDGSKLSSIDTKGEYLLDVSADGNWEVEIKQPRPSIGKQVPLTLSGTGQKASEIFYLNTGMARFEMKHDGTSNFAIVLYSADGKYIDLLVNTIGSFDGSKATPISKAGLYLLDISADGNWEISIE